MAKKRLPIIALGPFTARGLIGRGQPRAIFHLAWWAWRIGAASLFTIISILALPKLGAATMLGQLTAGALSDHFRWLERLHLNRGGFCSTGVSPRLARATNDLKDALCVPQTE